MKWWPSKTSDKVSPFAQLCGPVQGCSPGTFNTWLPGTHANPTHPLFVSSSVLYQRGQQEAGHPDGGLRME